jgi:hypothetical protein
MAHRLVLKRTREPRVVTCPRDRADDHAVTPARDPRRVGLHEREGRAEVQRAPAPAPIAEIKPRTAAPADPAAISLPPARPGRHDDLCFIADPHVLDDRPLQTQQARPYPDAAHVASAPLDSSPQEAGTLGAARRAPLNQPLTSPTGTAGAPVKGPALSCLRRNGGRSNDATGFTCCYGPYARSTPKGLCRGASTLRISPRAGHQLHGCLVIYRGRTPTGKSITASRTHYPCQRFADALTNANA